MALLDSIAQTIAEQGRIRAQGLTNQAQIWGNLARDLGQIPGEVIGLSRQFNEQEIADQQRKQQMQLQQVQLQQAQRQAAGQQELAGILQGDQLRPGEVGPTRSPLLTADGLYDIPNVTKLLSQSGYGDMAPALLKNAEAINDSVTKHREDQAKLEAQRTVLLGRQADSILQLTKGGMPFQQALDVTALPTISGENPMFSPQEYAQIRTKLLQMTPDQQQATLMNLMDQAAKIGPTKTLAEGATEVDMFGRTVASGAPKEPTPAKLRAAYQAAVAVPEDQRTPEQQATVTAYEKAESLEHPAPKRTEAEQELDAYAKSIGKKDAGELTYADRQVFEQNKEKIRSNTAFQQHMRERQYDIGHPTAGESAVKVEHKDPTTGKTVIEYIPRNQLAGRTFEKGTPAAVENRLASAQAVSETGDDMTKLLQNPAYAKNLGVAMGRFNSFRDFLGNPPPEFSELAGMIESYSLANMGVHGMRSVQGANDLKKLLDQKHTPESLASAIKGISAFSKKLLQDQGRTTTGATGGTTTTTAPPPPVTPGLTYQDYLRSRGK